MFKLILILFLSGACASSKIIRKIAQNDNIEFIELQYDVGSCIQSNQLATYSLLRELYLVNSYDDTYYYVTKYQPQGDVNGKIFIYSSLGDEDFSWSKQAESQFTFKYAHSKFKSMECPNNL